MRAAEVGDGDRDVRPGDKNGGLAHRLDALALAAEVRRVALYQYWTLRRGDPGSRRPKMTVQDRPRRARALLRAWQRRQSLASSASGRRRMGTESGFYGPCSQRSDFAATKGVNTRGWVLAGQSPSG